MKRFLLPIILLCVLSACGKGEGVNDINFDLITGKSWGTPKIIKMSVGMFGASGPVTFYKEGKVIFGSLESNWALVKGGEEIKIFKKDRYKIWQIIELSENVLHVNEYGDSGEFIAELKMEPYEWQ